MLYFRKSALALLVILTIIIVSSCGPDKPGARIDDLHWLEGNWVDSVSNYHESWHITESGDLIGFGHTIAGVDTLFSEQLNITVIDRQVTYIATVPDQNEGESIAFPLKQDSDDVYIFENDSHDFPNRIIYTRSGNLMIELRVENRSGEKGFDMHLIKIGNEI